MYPVLYPCLAAVPYCPLMYRMAPVPYDYNSIVNGPDMKERNCKVENEGKDDNEEQQEKITAKQYAPIKGYRFMRGEEETMEEREDMQIHPMGQQLTGIPKQPVISSAQILRMVEVHHPDIIRRMTEDKVSSETARDLIRKVIEITLMYCR